jgi:hypothetical protein
MITRRHLTAAAVAAMLVLPAGASAMPIDNGRPVPPKTQAPPPAARTVVESSDDTLPIAVAGAALLVALASAGYSAIRLAPLRAS